MVIIKDLSGLEHNIDCIACSIQRGEISSPVERIAETKYFVAEQDFEYPIEGFLIIASKRHIKSVSEFTEEEQKDFANFLVKCRKAMKEKLGIEEATLIQEESSSSSHFHLWLFPWLPWMGDVERKISNIKELMDKAKKEHLIEAELSKIKDSSRKLKSFFGLV
jgi:diadenosine tetraphosphate (Ap4A) HIT family hydrolase